MGLEIILNNNELNRTTLSHENLKALLKTVDELPSYIGATPFGENHNEVVVIANFIMRRFRTITPEKLVDAFELAACGELFDGHQRVKVTSYGKPLNIDVMGTVLMAYKQRQEKERARPKPAPVNRQIESGEKFVATPEYHYLNMLSQIDESGELPKVHLWKTIHGYMVEKGMLKPMAKNVVVNRSIKSLGDGFALDTHRMAIQGYLIENKVITPQNDVP